MSILFIVATILAGSTIIKVTIIKHLSFIRIHSKLDKRFWANSISVLLKVTIMLVWPIKARESMIRHLSSTKNHSTFNKKF